MALVSKTPQRLQGELWTTDKPVFLQKTTNHIPATSLWSSEKYLQVYRSLQKPSSWETFLGSSDLDSGPSKALRRTDWRHLSKVNRLKPASKRCSKVLRSTSQYSLQRLFAPSHIHLLTRQPPTCRMGSLKVDWIFKEILSAEATGACTWDRSRLPGKCSDPDAREGGKMTTPWLPVVIMCDHWSPVTATPTHSLNRRPIPSFHACTLPQEPFPASYRAPSKTSTCFAFPLTKLTLQFPLCLLTLLPLQTDASLPAPDRSQTLFSPDIFAIPSIFLAPLVSAQCPSSICCVSPASHLNSNPSTSHWCDGGGWELKSSHPLLVHKVPPEIQ